MQFVLNPNPLPISDHQKKSEGLQYYEWKYKQKLAEEDQKLKELQKFLQEIEKEQEQERKNNLNKKRMHHAGTFYDYSMQWKKRVQNKVDEEKMLKEKQFEKVEESLRKTVEREDKKEISFGYKGPIEGWQEHFQNYLKKKSHNDEIYPEQLTFEPKINDRSRKMTQGMVGRVEDRLLMFGQYTKMKNQEEINKLNSEALNEHFPNQKYSTGASNKSDIFYRLYKQGEENNKKKREGALDDRHTFQPKINKLPQEIEDKIMKSRKPLYYIKHSLSNEAAQFNRSLHNGEEEKKQPKGNFQAFLKRNQALLQQKKKMLLTMRQHIEQKENLEKSQCTFSPVLNPNSKKIQKILEQNNKKFQQKLQTQIKSSLSPEQNIDISKLTVPEYKETSRYSDSDSLSIYRIENEHKERESQRSLRKEQEYETHISSSKMKSDRNQKSVRTLLGEGIGEVEEDQGDAGEGEGEGEGEDSIQRMKKGGWEDELESIQSCIQGMMMRAIK